MNFPICEHIKTGGVRCGSPALRDLKYCHHHAELDPLYPNQLPYLEDTAALQMGYMQFIRCVADNRIDARRAKLLLEALKGASTNVRHAERLQLRAVELAGRRKPSARVGEHKVSTKRRA